ncbi:hypothetical protein [Azonexus sp. IMCC34839]|uniref:hypothetical protein n=1 Tax=Azonexus sp. IMCC34839 TaxID=3133695 RepID=UPI00399BBC35
MNAGWRADFGYRLSQHPHLLLAGHLLALHALAFGGWHSPVLRVLWVVAIGLFLMWQPFVAGERRISLGQGALLLGAVLLSTLFLNPWLLLIWCGALGAAIGGRVLWTERRGERSGYLLAFGFLVTVTVLGVVPEVSATVSTDPLPRELFARWLPWLLPSLVLFPAQAPRRRAGDAFDLFYGVLVFLVLAVFVLGALAYMLVGGVGYIRALVHTSLALAGALLLVAWAWNPRGGFSGIGSALSRYLLSVGMPVEQWLVQLAEDRVREPEPRRFLNLICQRLQTIPWVLGAAWENRADGDGASFGEATGHAHGCEVDGVLLSVYFRHPPSPAMRWHLEWLLRLALEFYQVKRQAYELQRLNYQRAVYETGARVTHDVKNLLQSLQTLCYAAAQPADPAELSGLLRRQLPQIAERLKGTLDKLQAPSLEVPEWADAAVWWAALRERYAHANLLWEGEAEPGKRLPGTLFDSVAENLLQNTLAKRQRNLSLEVRVSFLNGALRVRDDGDSIAPDMAAVLLREPVPSEDGLGIGLFHAARQAEAAGYRLELSINEPGLVEFSLSARPM